MENQSQHLAGNTGQESNNLTSNILNHANCQTKKSYRLHRFLVAPIFIPVIWISDFFGYTYQGLLLPVLTFTILLTAGFICYSRSRSFSRKNIYPAIRRFLMSGLVWRLPRSMGTNLPCGELREVSFLFTDIEGFTSLAENIPTRKLGLLMNTYLDEASEIVIRHGGTIDKIVGDALHVMFNAPTSLQHHAQHAVECALELDAWSSKFRCRQLDQGINLGVTRIGVNTGECMVGNFGGKHYFDYTAHGDAINTAARLENFNKHLGTTICVSQSTAERCRNIYFRPIATLILYGKMHSIDVFLPVPIEKIDSSFNHKYEQAYQQLRKNSPESKPLFESLSQKYPEDPLVLLHLLRFARGEFGATIVATSK